VPAQLPDANEQRQLRELAELAARAGAAIARRYFDADYGVRLKNDRSEVSEADEAAQAAIIETLRAARPDDGLITEEDLHLDQPPAAPTDDRCCWIIDPIDGTRNFVRRVPLYSTVVAAMFGGHPLVGVVYDVSRDRLFSASQAEGLFINGEPIGTSRERRAGSHPKLLVAIPSSPTPDIMPITQQWLGKHVNRNLGSTALHLAMVATGEFDAMLADNPKLWDIAAGALLVTSTGGRITTPQGNDIFPIDVATYNREKLPTLAVTRPDLLNQLRS
jgi:myo-inositol-1(or 4)-monophosphatase